MSFSNNTSEINEHETMLIKLGWTCAFEVWLRRLERLCDQSHRNTHTWTWPGHWYFGDSFSKRSTVMCIGTPLFLWLWYFIGPFSNVWIEWMWEYDENKALIIFSPQCVCAWTKWQQYNVISNDRQNAVSLCSTELQIETLVGFEINGLRYHNYTDGVERMDGHTECQCHWNTTIFTILDSRFEFPIAWNFNGHN